MLLIFSKTGQVLGSFENQQKVRNQVSCLHLDTLSAVVIVTTWLFISHLRSCDVLDH